MAKRKTFAEKIAETPLEEISKWKQKEMATTLKKLRTSYSRRIASFHKKGIVSEAEVTFSAGNSMKRNIDDMTRNQMLYEVARLQAFFQSRTSTERGVREVNKEQDARIFGVNRRGTPKYTMSNEERARYWALYSEYHNMYKAESTRYSSENIQQMLGEILRSREINPSDFVSILDRVQSELESQRESELEEDFAANVYQGRGNNSGR